MKPVIFNFKRVGLLFQRYFTERFHTELIYWGIMVIVFIFIRNSLPVMPALIVIAGAFYASRFFREIHYPNSGISYFMIPATQLEKLVVGIVMTSFYYFLMMISAYVIGNLIGTGLNNLLANMNLMNGLINIFQYSPLQWKLFMTSSSGLDVLFFADLRNNMLFSLFSSFLIIQSIFLLGSIYFKNNQVFKTFLVMVIAPILLSVLIFIEAYLIFGGFKNMNYLSINFPDRNLLVFDVMKVCLYFVFLIFFWVVSYFRLTEKQV